MCEVEEKLTLCITFGFGGVRRAATNVYMNTRKPDLQKVGSFFERRTFFWDVPQRGRKGFTALIEGKSLEGMFDICYRSGVGFL